MYNYKPIFLIIIFDNVKFVKENYFHNIIEYYKKIRVFFLLCMYFEYESKPKTVY